VHISECLVYSRVRSFGLPWC